MSIGIIIIAILVLSIQLFLVYSLHRVAKTKRLFVKIRWLIPYIMMMLVSVFFSYGFYYKLLRAESYAKDNFNIQLLSAKENAQKYLAAFEAIQAGGDQLQVYSLARSNEEKQFGGTCGDNSPPGKGPRQLFRLKEAEQFNYIAKNIKPLTKNVKSEISELQKSIESYSSDIGDIKTFQQDLNNIVSRINGNNTSFILSYTKQAIKSRVGRNRNNIISENIGCPDRSITDRGNIMLENISSLPVLEEIKLFDPNNDQEVLKRALQVFKTIPNVVLHYLLQPAQALENTKKTQESIILKKADYIPLILGAVIDFMLLIIGVTNGVKSRQNNWLSPKFEGEYFSVTDAKRIKTNLELKQVIDVLQPYMLKKLGGYFFIIPSKVVDEHPLSGKLLEMFEVMATERIEPAYLRNIPIRWIPSSVKAQLEQLYKDIDDKPNFNFYRMNTAQWDEFKQAFNVSNG